VWFRKAAEQGYAPASLQLARMYRLGDGRDLGRDPAQSLMWFRKAAEQGSSAAAFDLGRRYEIGEGVPLDLAQALGWYRKAAADKTYWLADASAIAVRSLEARLAVPVRP